MRTPCLQCGRTNVESRIDCVNCGAPLPVSGNQNQINFLLNELPFWVARGWVEPRRRRMFWPANTATAGSGSLSDQSSPVRPRRRLRRSTQQSIRSPLPSRPSRRQGQEPRREPLSAFMEQASITYWHFIGLGCCFSPASGVWWRTHGTA